MATNVLVTGGAGLIGSHICRRLLAEGYQPVVYDAFVQYISPFESRYQKFLERRFQGIRDQIIFKRGDTRDKYDVQRTIVEYRPEIVIHLAALPIADFSFVHPEETVGSILLGTINVLDTIKEVDFVKRLVYTSSSMVYGDFQEVPCPEEHPKRPKDVYGGTKLAGEIMVETYGRRYGIEYTIVRPSAVYGPTDVNQRVGQIFVENAMSGQVLTLHGGGENVLDFTYVEDSAEGILLAATKAEGANEVFNITRGEGRSLLEFAEILKEHFPELKLKVEPMKVYRPRRGALSIKKARERLGFDPKYSLEQGVKKYIEFYRRVTSEEQ